MCQVALANLDAVLLEARYAFESLPQHILAQIETVFHASMARSTSAPLEAGVYHSNRDRCMQGQLLQVHVMFHHRAGACSTITRTKGKT